MNGVIEHNFRQLGDKRGNLVVVDGVNDISFDPVRFFYIYNSDKSVVRGQHANVRTKFVLINVAGKSKVKIMDGKGNEQIVVLDQPRKGVFIDSMLWKEMYDFSKGSILIVLASEHYDPTEYIRDWDDYVERIKNEDTSK
jgi:dTDP-4-dehydrorhamnose 3,5-epimerase-like enzyme